MRHGLVRHWAILLPLLLMSHLVTPVAPIHAQVEPACERMLAGEATNDDDLQCFIALRRDVIAALDRSFNRMDRKENGLFTVAPQILGGCLREEDRNAHADVLGYCKTYALTKSIAQVFRINRRDELLLEDDDPIRPCLSRVIGRYEVAPNSWRRALSECQRDVEQRLKPRVVALADSPIPGARFNGHCVIALQERNPALLSSLALDFCQELPNDQVEQRCIELMSAYNLQGPEVCSTIASVPQS